MYTATPDRLCPKQLLETEYSEMLFSGFDDQGNETYQKADTPPAERLPDIEEIINFSNDDLVLLAHRIAGAYKFLLLSANDEQKKPIIDDLPFNIKIKKAKNSSTNSLALRLSDKKWWRRQIIKLADEKREHIAQINKELGGKSPKQICCTSKTIEMYKERKERTDEFLRNSNKIIMSKEGEPYLFNLLQASNGAKQSKLNEIFLTIKSMEEIAEARGLSCAFITLTADSEFHSNPKVGKDKYLGASAKEANQSLQKIWRSILDALDNIDVGRKSGEYFGIRVTEPHEDGCPHWHILLFFNDELGIIETIQHSISRLYAERGSYFENNKDQIIKIIEKTDDTSAKPSSYIFRYVAFALATESSLNDSDQDLAMSYKCAISSMRARQYAFFGIKCSVGKLRALKKVAHSDDAPEHIKKLAMRVHPTKDIENRNAEQLAARIEFITESSNSLAILKEEAKNKYGEIIQVGRHIKHELDDKAIQISGLCQDVTAEQAERLRRKETKPVTVIINYSRKSKDKRVETSCDISRRKPSRSTRRRKAKELRQLASSLGMSIKALFDEGIIKRRTYKGILGRPRLNAQNARHYKCSKQIQIRRTSRENAFPERGAT